MVVSYLSKFYQIQFFWVCFHNQKDHLFFITEVLFVIAEKDDAESIENQPLIQIRLL
jgi:hypothetical protein